jgi:hypothetical protein
MSELIFEQEQEQADNHERRSNLRTTTKKADESQGFYKTKELAEGVGFEPTVGCPTLDFESSALNRTQPPFHSRKIDIHLVDPEKSAFIMRRGRSFANSRGALESLRTRDVLD